ncbi:MAG: 23S rRNA (pseudouridine(1915)-N(3))-methyltransferase RlmH [Bacteroidales bacterium]|nr:23S rRNA (pseudouridine(1915)-N(3))-methyltransferase RlmH [Bacteroidales bacterium]
MKIRLVMMGKTKEQFTDEGYSFYKNRVVNYLPFDDLIIPGLKNSGGFTPDEFRWREGELLMKHTRDDDFLVLLDERGKAFTSRDFARFVQQRMNTGIKTLTFIIGGAYGFSDEVYKAAHFKLSLSSMTFPHQLVRIVFMEQLYRAMTILRNEPYHNE